MTAESQSSTEKIGPTAWMVAYRRTFTDIPLCNEIFNELESLRINSGEPEVAAELQRPETAPQFEARYKLVDRLLGKTSIRQVLELASGFSPRGMNMVQGDITYVEVDLPGVMGNKRAIAEKLQPATSNTLHLENGNVLELKDLEHTIQHFDPNKSLAIINEGLMRYLNLEEKAILAKNVHTLLSKFGGVWITPDISLKKTQENEDKITSDHIKKISEMTGVDIAGNRFDNADQAKTFFENLGFSIESHSFLEVTGELSSVKRQDTSQEMLMRLNGDAVVFVMRVKNN